MADQPDNLNAWLAIGGGGAAAVGSLLPWAQITAPFVGSISKAGTEGDGQITLLLALLVGGVGIALTRVDPQRAHAVLITLAAVAGLGVVGVNYVDIRDNFGSDTLLVSPGSGMVLTGVGMGVALIGGLRQLGVAKLLPEKPPPRDPSS
jgi:hypothetical protein